MSTQWWHGMISGGRSRRRSLWPNLNRFGASTTPTTTALIPTLMGAVIIIAGPAVIPSLAQAVGMIAAQPSALS